MINKNQYEKSVIMLKQSLPVFVRKAYEEFTKCLGEIAAEYGKISKDQPYSVEKACTKLFETRSFFALYFNSFANDIRTTRLIRATQNMRVFHEGNDRSKDEEFYTVNGPDLFAPVTTIESAITLFGITKHQYNDNSPIPLCFEVTRGSRNYNRKADDFQQLNWSEVEGFNGTKTILDCLASRLVLDLGGLFDKFFLKLAEGCGESEDYRALEGESPIRHLEMLCNLSAAAVDPVKAGKIVDFVTGLLMPSVIATYFVFASRLVGAKNDIYQWMYTSFVKDSVTHFDEINYPTRAPVTVASGHADNIGEPHGITEQREVAGNPLMDSQPVQRDDIQRLKRIMIYRNIRMQYSVWASIINAVLSTSCVESSYLKWERSKEKIAGYGLENNGITYNVLQMTVNALYAYIKARYRTYNLTQQLDAKTNVPYQSVKTMGYAIDRVKDEEAVAIIKATIAGKHVEDALITTTADDYKVLGANNVADNQLSEIVLHSAYCLLMVKMIASLGKAKDVTEPATGRPIRDVFAEIFYGILNGINDKYQYITKFTGRDWLSCDCISKATFDILVEVTKYFSPLCGFTRTCHETGPAAVDTRLGDNWGVYIPEDQFVSDSLNKIKDEIKEAPNYFKGEELYFSIGRDLCDIPLFSDILELRFSIKFDTSVFNDDPVPDKIKSARLNDQNGQSLFPKNRLILEGIEKMNFSSSRAFASLESANKAIADIELLADLATEGADAMASNACYSSLAGAIGGIASMEITNDGAAIDIDPNGEKGTITPESPVDANNNILGPTPSDPKDQAELTNHSMESAHQQVERELMASQFNKTTESINKLFNSLILGIK